MSIFLSLLAHVVPIDTDFPFLKNKAIMPLWSKADDTFSHKNQFWFNTGFNSIELHQGLPLSAFKV